MRAQTSSAAYAGLAVTPSRYLELPEDPDYRYDVIDGVMHVSPSPTAEHSSAAGEFYFRLRQYLASAEAPAFAAGGRAFMELDVLLPDGGDPLRPDVHFVRTERLHIVDRYTVGTPDLVMEVLSPRTAERDLGGKSDRFMRCGVQEYWLLDPRDQSLRLRTPGPAEQGAFFSERQVQAEGVLRSRLLPGFAVGPADLLKKRP